MQNSNLLEKRREKRANRLWFYNPLTILRYFFLTSILWVLFYKYVPPPLTYLMVSRYFQESAMGSKSKAIDKEWVSCQDVSRNFKLAVLSGEDQLFFSHYGFDWKAIKRAWQANETSRLMKGGSTISQQTAKNVFLWPSRSWIRKGFEAYFTILIELFWSKERILEVYMNVVEMGKNTYGVEAASKKYFNTSSAVLSKKQSALIVACFPNPRRWNPKSPTPYILKRSRWIVANIKTVEKLMPQ